MNSNKRKAFVSALASPLIGLLGPAVLAAEALPGEAARLRVKLLAPTEAAPRIDGHLDEAIWAQVPPHDGFYQYEPADNQVAPSELRTTVQVLADRDALIIGVRAWDKPEQIHGVLTRRDQVYRDQDFISVWLDPTGRGGAAQFIRVGVAGSLADGLYRADEDKNDFGPDFPIEAAVQRLSDGYSMEIRWPLASLRYPYVDGAPWRITVARSIPHADGMLLLSAPLTKDDLNLLSRQQQMEGLDELLGEVRDRSFLSVRPELTLRQRRSREARDSKASLGADIHWRPRADWVFNATLNPDFSQVELDVPTSSGASRIALSLPEKRAFFLESADVLGLPLPAFYSRTITDPRWGARATWRGANADATVLSVNDDQGGTLLRGSPYLTEEWRQTRVSQASLVRARWHGQLASWGLLASARDYGEGRQNRAVGLDGQWRGALGEGGQGQLRWTMLRSDNTAGFDEDGNPWRSPRREGSYLSAKADYRSADWIHEIDWQWIGPGFVHDNGFVAQSGVRNTEWKITRRLGDPSLVLAGSTLSLYDLEATLALFDSRTLADPTHQIPGGEVVERRFQPGISLWAARRTNLWLDLGLDQRRARPYGRLHEIPAVHLGFESAPWPWLASISGEFTVGRRLDDEADRVGRGGNGWLEAQLRFPLRGGWSLESDHRWSRAWVRDPAGQPAYIESSWRWLAVLHLSPRDSLRWIAQNTLLEHRADVRADIEPWAERERHRSLLYRHSWGHGRSWSAGWVRERAPGRESRELTVKLQWEL
ncbi:hypothetical protein [Chitinimonas lacunae]|uniref:Carbohydrate binding family 9 domain-containing protein n=1 Tax=Chitinimonas lacunae TaxID=1963018 RepID=A0ABV8MLT7_9NEIS